MYKKLTLCIISALMLLPLMSCQTESLRGAPGDIRDYPGTYHALVAVCSDIDGSTVAEYEAIHRFLNTKEQTSSGPGLGLDISDSMWIYNFNDDDTIHDFEGHSNDHVMSYLWQDSVIKHGKAIEKYYKAGWIDSIHTYGDFSSADKATTKFTRALAQTAAQAMKDVDIQPSIWINHGNEANVQNMEQNQQSTYRQGAQPDSEYYHADITIPGGIKYVWFSFPSAQYGSKSPLYPVTLQDGQKVWGFKRYTGEDVFFAHKYNWTIFGINQQFTKKKLDTLVNERNTVIVAQHLGGANYQYPFTQEALDGLTLLASYQENGEILVSRTSRVLEYIRIRDNLVFEYYLQDGKEVVDILSVNDPQLGETTPRVGELRGITFYVTDSATAEVRICGQRVDEKALQRNTAPTQSIGFIWYEPDYTDYTKDSF